MFEPSSIAIKTKDLSVDFYQQRILNNVHIAFEKKHTTVLVGRSGSGKTTLLRSLNCLNQEYEGCNMQGCIQVDLGAGLVNVYDSNARKPATDLLTLRRKVGMLFQTPQLLPVSILRNITMPMEFLSRLSKQDAQNQAQKMLEMVGLWNEVKDRLHSGADILSTGQQQRLCLARTLALEPSVLLLDEPTSSLDVNATRQIEELLIRLKKQYTIILVSHGLEQAKYLADTLLLFDQGQVVKKFSKSHMPSLTTLENWFCSEKKH